MLLEKTLTSSVANCVEGKYILRLVWSQGSVIEGEGTILPRFLETVLKKSILTHVQAHAYLGFGH